MSITHWMSLTSPWKDRAERGRWNISCRVSLSLAWKSPNDPRSSFLALGACNKCQILRLFFSYLFFMFHSDRGDGFLLLKRKMGLSKRGPVKSEHLRLLPTWHSNTSTQFYSFIADGFFHCNIHAHAPRACVCTRTVIRASAQWLPNDLLPIQDRLLFMVQCSQLRHPF